MDHLSQAGSAVLPVLALDVHKSGGQEAKKEAKVQPPLKSDSCSVMRLSSEVEESRTDALMTVPRAHVTR